MPSVPTNCYEFVSIDIGSQDSFLAWGRYDGLIKKMGGPDYPGCGFAAGVERIRLLCSKNLKLPSTKRKLNLFFKWRIFLKNMIKDI